MDEGILNSLTSSLAHERLTAARQLAKSAVHNDAKHIQKAIAQETVPWVKQALKRALDRLIPHASAYEELGFNLDSFSNAITRDITLRNGDQIASALLHEILPKLGFIRNAAAREIVDFENSETLKKINFLEELLNLIGEFRKVSKTPTLSEFDLSDLIETISAEHPQFPTLKAGPRPTIVKGEPTRLHLAISNGLRNAIDSSLALNQENQNPIAISWGITDTDYWISIVDAGVGLAGNIAGMFTIGTSNKTGEKNFGMGLPLARQALNSLGGDVSLASSLNGGARFEIKWPKIAEKNKDTE